MLNGTTLTLLTFNTPGDFDNGLVVLNDVVSVTPAVGGLTSSNPNRFLIWRNTFRLQTKIKNTNNPKSELKKSVTNHSDDGAEKIVDETSRIQLAPITIKNFKLIINRALQAKNRFFGSVPLLRCIRLILALILLQ